MRQMTLASVGHQSGLQAPGCEKAVCYDLCWNAAGRCGAPNWNKIAVSGSDQVHRNSYDMIIQKYLVV